MNKNFIVVLFASIYFITPSFAQEKLDQITLDKFYEGLQIAIKNNDVFNAYFFRSFAAEYVQKSYLGIILEVEKIKGNFKNQKIVFKFLYNFFNSGLYGNPIDRETLLFNFLTNSFYLDNNNARIITNYIDNRNYLTDLEKKKQDEEVKKAHEKANHKYDIISKVYEVKNEELGNFISILAKRLQNYFFLGGIEEYFFYGKYNIYAGQERERYGASPTAVKFYPFLIFEELNGMKLPMMSHYVRNHKVAPIKTNVSDNRFYTIRNISGIGVSVYGEIPTYYVEQYQVSFYSIFKKRNLLFAKGIVKIKIKNDEIIYLENEPKNTIAKELLEKEVKKLNLNKGKHKIRYFFQNILDEQMSNDIEII